jgi:hydroxymethylbilane synthase
MSERVRIGTRASALALWQANWVGSALRSLGVEVELIEIRTRGDRDRNSPLSAIEGGTGIFTKEIQRALLDRSIDLAVHSLKDLPTNGPAELTLASVPPRHASNDVLISARFGTLPDLPTGARVGTGSLRRQAMLLHERPDLRIVPIRGNVETRLARASSEGDLDAVVLAEAGLDRLGLSGRITERLFPPRFLPAVGQGALALECRSDDAPTCAMVAKLDDATTHRAVEAERRALAELEGGCMIPLGAWGREENGMLALDVAVYSVDGQRKITAKAIAELDSADALGRSVAALLLEQGAAELLERVAGRS